MDIAKILKILGTIIVILTYSFFLAVGAAIFANKRLIGIVANQVIRKVDTNSSYTEVIKEDVVGPILNPKSLKPKTIYIEPEYNYTGSELLTQVNLFRNQNDRAPLEHDSCLCGIANARKDELTLAGELDNHKGFEERSVFDICPAFTYMGENLAQGYLTARETVFEGWEKSTDHRFAMDREEFTHGCAATEKGISVLILGGQSK